MGFPRRLLNDHEDIVLDLNPHWWFLSGPVAMVAGTMVLAVLDMTQDLPRFLDWLTLVLVLAGLVWLGARYLRWTTTNFVLTTDRLIFRTGVVAKHGIEIPLERVNNVIFRQSVFERLLGAGDLVIESAGESGQQAFTDVSHPSEVQNEIYRQIEANELRTASLSAAARESSSIPEQIDKLDELRRRGVITDEEFDAKKRDLLDRM